MKKTMLAIAALALGSSVIAGPMEDKVNAYNAIRAARPNTPVLELGTLIRNEVGVTSSNPGPGGNTCTICGVGSTPGDRPGAGGALTPNNPTATTPDTPSASLMNRTPDGLGVPPPAIVRTPEGTGAAWQSPTTEPDKSKYAGYESQYKYYLDQYNASVANIMNEYMDPNNGKLAQARRAVLHAVEIELNAWIKQNPGASLNDQANYESARIEAHANSAVGGLTAQYQQALDKALSQFNNMMNWVRSSIENPNQGNDGGA